MNPRITVKVLLSELDWPSRLTKSRKLFWKRISVNVSKEKTTSGVFKNLFQNIFTSFQCVTWKSYGPKITQSVKKIL
jgi:hypothetical protein